MNTMKLFAPLGLPIPELRGTLGAMKYPAFGELKLDGEFTFVIYRDHKIVTINKYNKVRTDFPELNNILYRLESTVQDCILLAELYHGTGKRNALYDLNSNKQSNDLHIYPFDVIETNGISRVNDPLIDRKELLQEMIGMQAALPKVLQNEMQVSGFFSAVVGLGYEGVVIKSLDSPLVNGPCSWVKLKMKDQNDYSVCHIDPTLERIEVSVPTPDPNSKNGGIRVCCVGVKAPLRYKRHIKLGDQVTIEHQGVLDSGSLRHPVLIPKKEWK